MLAKGGEAGSRGTKWPSYEEQSLSSSLNQPPPPPCPVGRITKKTELGAIHFMKNPYLCEAAVLSALFLVFRQQMRINILHFID